MFRPFMLKFSVREASNFGTPFKKHYYCTFYTDFQVAPYALSTDAVARLMSNS